MSESLELESQVIMNRLVSGTEPKSSAKTGNIPNYRAFSTELLPSCENKAVPTKRSILPHPLSIITFISKLFKIHHMPHK